MNKILLTGPPGCGKATIVQKLAKMLSGAAGFFTAEIREEGSRKGFRLIDLKNGEGQVLSHVNIKSSQRIGKYGVDVDSFDIFLEELNLNSPAVIIDEIGKMECLSKKFRLLIEKLLTSDTTVIATIALQGTSFIESLKRMTGTKLILVTPENRNSLPDIVIHSLQE